MKAKLVYFEITTRVIVPDNATQDEIMHIAALKVADQMSTADMNDYYVGQNDDKEQPFDSSTDN